MDTHTHTHRDIVMERGACRIKSIRMRRSYIKIEVSCYLGIFFIYCFVIILKKSPIYDPESLFTEVSPVYSYSQAHGLDHASRFPLKSIYQRPFCSEDILLKMKSINLSIPLHFIMCFSYKWVHISFPISLRYREEFCFGSGYALTATDWLLQACIIY